MVAIIIFSLDLHAHKAIKGQSHNSCQNKPAGHPTHAFGQMPMIIDFVDPQGNQYKTLRRD